MKLKMILLMSWFCVTSDHVFADAAVQVYECVINGQHVFSDHACGDNAKQRDVVVANRMDTVDSHTLKQSSKPSKAAHRQTRTSAADERRQKCARIRKSKDAIDERMKAGFSAKQDERLHDRLRKLNDEYFEQRCSGLQ